MIAVVIPTLRGREKLLERTLAAYRATTPDLVTIVVRDRPTIGQAWNAGAAAALEADEVRYLNLSADDVEPQPGWSEAAAYAADNEIYPSPRILNPDGSLHSCGTMGGGLLLPECGTGTPCGSSPFPFMRASNWWHIGPAPDIHYYADDFLGWSARNACLEVAVERDYLLHHLEGLTGRTRVVHRAMADRAIFLKAVAQRSPAEVTA